MKEILSNPLKFWMLVGLAAVEIPAIVFLIVAWCKACKEAKERDKNDQESTDQW